jgi:hypothetical protein
VPDSVGLVVENERRPGDLDGFEWFCFGCGTLLHRFEISVADIVKGPPPDWVTLQKTCGCTWARGSQRCRLFSDLSRFWS